jgi:hypothetical protein
VGRIRITVEQADGHRVIGAARQLRDQNILHRRVVQLFYRAPVGTHALNYFKTVSAAHHRLRFFVPQVVNRAPVVTLQKQDVAKPAGRYESHSSALALQDGVGRNRRAVAQVNNPTECNAR